MDLSFALSLAVNKAVGIEVKPSKLKIYFLSQGKLILLHMFYCKKFFIVLKNLKWNLKTNLINTAIVGQLVVILQVSSTINFDCSNIDPVSLKPNGDPDGSSKTPSKKPNTGKKHCPCGKSSGGERWILTCFDCKQMWHDVCAGLKANFTKQVLESLLKTWQCPWCYSCTYSKGDSHQSLQNAKNISEKVIITSTIKQITDAIAEESGKLSGNITNLENRLSSVNSDVDAIRGTQGLISQKVLPIKDIETHLQHQLISQASLDEKMKLMQSSLAKLQDEVSCFSSRNHQPPTVTVHDTLPAASQQTPLLHKQEFMTDMKDNFLDEDAARSIQEFLDNASFKEENGHSVLAYGVPYKYTGARAPTEVPAVPEQLRSLMDQINKLQEDTF